MICLHSESRVLKVINFFTSFTYSDSILLRHSSFREPAVSRIVTEHHSDRKRLKQVNFHHSFSIYLRSKKTAHSFSYKNFRSSLSMDFLLQLPLEEEIVKINTVKPFLAFFQEFFRGGGGKIYFHANFSIVFGPNFRGGGETSLWGVDLLRNS